MAHEDVRGTGGIIGLGRLIRDRWSPLEADFARYYQIHLGQACFGPQPIGTRRLLTLIDGLPPDSAFVRDQARQPTSHKARPTAQRATSSPDQIRRAGGQFIHAPKGG